MFYGFIKFPLSKGQTGLFHQPIIIMDPMKQFGIKLFLFALLQSFTFLLFFLLLTKVVKREHLPTIKVSYQPYFFVSNVDKVGLVTVD